MFNLYILEYLINYRVSFRSILQCTATGLTGHIGHSVTYHVVEEHRAELDIAVQTTVVTRKVDIIMDVLDR